MVDTLFFIFILFNTSKLFSCRLRIPIKGPSLSLGAFLSFHHLTFYVGNAKQAASYYISRMGFEPLAYKGLETGFRKYAAHAIKQNKVVFVFVSPYDPKEIDINQHIVKHGDGVKDISIDVEDLENIIRIAKQKGAEIVKDIWTESDEDGYVKFATIQTYGDTTHTLMDKKMYKGFFLPGYTKVDQDILCQVFPPTNLDFIDHVVGNQPNFQMEPVTEWYETVLQFHRFWSVDDSKIYTEHTALRVMVIANYEETIMMPITESAEGKKKSQTEEYVEYYGGGGVQHIALNTKNIIESVKHLRKRGVEFLKIPDLYYEMLEKRLKHSAVRIVENIEQLKELQILIDYDENGYLLQIFTKPLQDRPTVFLEIIQRNNFNGFGAGNVKALFEAVEMEQKKRGNFHTIDRAHVKNPHDFRTSYCLDYNKKPLSSVADFVWDQRLLWEGHGLRLIFDIDSPKYLENFSTVNDLSYNHYPKTSTDGPIPRKYRSEFHRYDPQQDYLINHGNITEYGLLNSMKEKWKCEKETATSCYQDTYIFPKIGSTSNKGIPRPNSSIVDPNNRFLYRFRLRDEQILSVPENKLVQINRKPLCNPITWECPYPIEELRRCKGQPVKRRFKNYLPGIPNPILSFCPINEKCIMPQK
ncbi:hypothetical protein FQA39_LY01272 [Lamprigera yunnana]|nr:hypothetical protein FQA39_LY01272 [Lamprigera yunnana]